MEGSNRRAARWTAVRAAPPFPWAAARPAAPEAAPARVTAPWCRIVQHPDGYTLQFGGGTREDLVERLDALLGAVPSQRRRWDPATRTWWIDPALENLFNVVTRWAERWHAPAQVQRTSDFGSSAGAWTIQADSGDAVAEGWVVEAGDSPAAAEAAQPEVTAGRPVSPWEALPVPVVDGDVRAEAYRALWLHPGAPAPVVKAAYRALAALHHPDSGGDLDTMRRLNAAYAVLRRHP